MARRAPTSLEVPGLEGVRLFAAVSVVFIHATLVAEPLRNGGAAGSWLARSAYLAVDVLFVVSGFAQFLPMAAAGPDRLPSWKGYAVRRVARIVPVYWAACVATAVYLGRWNWGWGTPSGVVGLWEFVTHLLFLNQLVFGVGGRNGFGPNQAMWTMTIEATFYVCLPFVARRFLRRPIVGLAVAFGIAAVWRVVAFVTEGSPFGPSSLITHTPAFAFHFAVGMAAAMVVTHLRSAQAAKDPAARHFRWVALLAFVWSVAAIAAWMRAADPAHHQFSQTYLADSRWVWNMTFAIPVGFLLVTLPFAPRWAIWPLSNPVSRWLGEGTFGTYLFHTLILLLIARQWQHLGHNPLALWEIGLLTTGEALLVGRLCYLILEQPPRRLAKRLAARIEAGSTGVRLPRPNVEHLPTPAGIGVVAAPASASN